MRLSRGLTAAAALALLVVGASCGEAKGPGATVAEVPVELVMPTTTMPPPTEPPATSVPEPAPVESTNPGVVVTPRGVVVPVLEELPDGLRVRTPCGATAVVSQGTRIREATIVLDPGHGGAESGAVSPDGLPEDEINLAISQRTKAALEAAGASVVLTRTADYDVTLPVRAEIAKSLAPRAMLSIHHNAQPDGPSARPGTETYYQIANPDSKRLAGILYEEERGAIAPYNAAWVADTDAGAKYREGTRGDYYAVLRMPAPVTSVLSEAAFITNPAEAELLTRPDFQDAEAGAIARAVVRYLTTADPGSGFTIPYPRVDPPPDPNAPPPAPCVDPIL